MWLFFYDPLTMIVLMIAYIVGWAAILVLAAKVAPRVASSVAGRFSLYTAMALTAAVIVVGGILAIYGLYTAATSFGYRIPIESMIVLLLILNLVQYLLAPWIINLSYGAKPSPELQRI